jgi:hypothetical protein
MQRARTGKEGGLSLLETEKKILRDQIKLQRENRKVRKRRLFEYLAAMWTISVSIIFFTLLFMHVPFMELLFWGAFIVVFLLAIIFIDVAR